ncbi:MAG: membrane protein insertase YidC [Gammaproteobacteria bacterium]|nr:membrane protein insertase YidC [Gammaproteobacteria bacterium]
MTSTNARMFLWLGLVLALWLNYETWQRDYALPVPPVATTAAAAPSAEEVTGLAASVPQAAATTTVATTANATRAVPAADVAGLAAPRAPATPTAVASTIKVVTDVLTVEVSLRGGDLVLADLAQYPLVKGEDARVRLLNTNPANFYLLQTGLTGAAGEARPTHLADFESAQTEYRMTDGADELRVPLVWRDAETGVTVTKTYVFKRGQYRIDLRYDVENAGAATWRAASYAQILRNDPPVETSMFSVESYAFQGPAYYDGIKYEKLDRDSAEDRALSRDIQGGWIAGMQHHFVAAIVPAGAVTYRYSIKTEGNQYLLSTTGPSITVAPSSGATFEETLFVGPKLQAQLEQAGPRLDLVADYGILTLLAKPLFWLLEQAYKLTTNWGWSIVLITLLLKLVFYPLSESSGKSMAKMRVLGPRMKNLQETYKDDREKLGRAMMDLYKREKINPLAGCLPILIQMPVFFAFYWVLLESVEMRQASFAFWIQDLSSRDPFFVLPIIMAGAMFVQYKLNPTPPDPIQAKVFMILPFIMSATFAFFPAGLVLYWVTNTLLSIAQQWNINRRIEAEAKKTRAA